MNTKYLKKITTRSYIRSKWVLELKNRGKMCKTPCQRANKQGPNQQGFHLIERAPNILEFCYFHTIHIEEMVNKYDLAQVINPQKQKMMASQFGFIQVRKTL